MEGLSPNLPHDIVSNILSRLPVKLLCRFKTVSKPWLSLITHPHFAKAQLNHSTKHNSSNTQKLLLASRASPSLYTLYLKAPAPGKTLADLEIEMSSKSPVRILGSCNGIVLVRMSDDLGLWNPTIRSYNKFSQPECPDGIVIYGLGYNSIRDDFFVVRAVGPLAVDGPSVVHLFSSQLGSWKRIGDLGYEIFHDGPGATVNGAPHWVVGRGGTGSSLVAGDVILRFDAFEERFKEVPLPPNEGGRDKFIGLRVLGGLLGVVQKDQKYESLARVWLMKEYGVKESWTATLGIAYGLREFCMPLCYEKNGDSVMVVDSEKLRILNMEKLTMTEIGIPHGCKFDAALFVESLFSPHGDNGTT